MNTLADFPEYAADAYIPTPEDMADWYASILEQEDDLETSRARRVAAREAWRTAYRKARIAAGNPSLAVTWAGNQVGRAHDTVNQCKPVVWLAIAAECRRGDHGWEFPRLSTAREIVRHARDLRLAQAA